MSEYHRLPDTNEEKLSRLDRIERAQGNVDREALADNEHTSLLLHVSDVETTGDRASGLAPTVRTVTTTAQSAVSALGHVIAPLAGAIPTPAAVAVTAVETARHIRNAASTYAHIARLEEIRRECHDEEMQEILEYAIRQKNSKAKREELAATPVVGICNTIYAKGHALKKMWNGTKGTIRMNYAERLWEKQRVGNDDARLACAELMGAKEYTTYKDTVDGHKNLAKKLKSTAG